METEVTNIKDLPVADRPRERLLKFGANTMPNAELIAIILGSGSKTFPLAAICKSLMDHLGNNLFNLRNLNVKDISKVNGIGEVKAITLLAALELGKRSLRPGQPVCLADDESIEQFISRYFTTDKSLQYHLIMLNNRDELLATSELATNKGGLPDITSLMRMTLDAGAAVILLCRNNLKLPALFYNQEKAFIIQLDAAASMFKIKFRGLLVIDKAKLSKQTGEL